MARCVYNYSHITRVYCHLKQVFRRFYLQVLVFHYLRLEMSAELLRQKELENLQQQQQRLLGSDPLGALPPGLPPDHPALRSLHDIPEGHPLREELARRTNAMLVLRHGSAAPLLTVNQQQQQQPVASSTPKDPQAQSSTARPQYKKVHCREPQTLLRVGDYRGRRDDTDREGDMEVHDEEMKDSDSETEMCEERRVEPSNKPREGELNRSKETGSKRGDESAKEAGESSGRPSAPCSSADTESPSRHIFTPGLGKADLKYHLPPGFIPPLHALHAQTLPFGFPYASPYFHAGEPHAHTRTHTKRSSDM